MERFYDNEDDDKDNESFFGSEDMYDEDDDLDHMTPVGFIDPNGMLEVMHMDLAQTELNQHLLSKAIEIAKSSWLWRFKDTQKRLEELEIIYRKLMSMTDDSNDDEKSTEGI